MRSSYIISIGLLLGACDTLNVRHAGEVHQVPPRDFVEGIASNYAATGLVVTGVLLETLSLPARILSPSSSGSSSSRPSSTTVGERMIDRGLNLADRSLRLVTGEEFQRLSRLPEYEPVNIQPTPQEQRVGFSDRCLLNSRTGDLVCEKTQTG